jgi:hypothetical protein
MRTFMGADWGQTIRLARMMTTRVYIVLLALMSIAGAPANGRAQAKAIVDGAKESNQVSSIGESLGNAKQHPLHIIYVHGIGATGAGDSQTFQRHICAFLKGCRVPKQLVPVGRDYADSGVYDSAAQPPSFIYMGNPVWTKQEEWRASAPFVDHYVLQRTGDPVVVDEINWWPLVFPLKCNAIMAEEARLAGPNKTYLDLCSQSEQDTAHPGRFKSFAWIKPEDAKVMESIRPKGALLNRGLKTSLLDWGFSDAMMAVGSMHDIFREGMRQLLVKSARFHADGSKTDEWEQPYKGTQGVDREFIVVSHSLGSYLVFSTLNVERQDVSPRTAPSQSSSDEATEREDAAAEYILQRTSLVYFFANQIPLLELANVEETRTAVALSKRIRKWRDLRENFGREHTGENEAPVKPPQLIAWSDPSDLLTWCIPEMKPLKIVNLYVRNTWWHWLIANPGTAHANYASNKNVLRMMMNSKAPDAKGEVCR